MFLALGVAGLILLTGTDLSVGRMVGMGMVTATIIMHNGINTGAVFGHVFDFRYACYSESTVCTVNVCNPYDSICHDCRILHGEIQNASVYLYHGEHADHLRSGYLCDQGCILRCD